MVQASCLFSEDVAPHGSTLQEVSVEEVEKLMDDSMESKEYEDR